MMGPMMMLVALIGAHSLADYAAQGDFMSKAKNRSTPIPGVPWWQVLAAHASIHGAAVALITGLWWLALAEGAIHFLTDDAKCTGRISYTVDQAIHVACKLLWWMIAMALAA